MGKWKYNSIILDLSIILRGMFSFTPRPLYSSGKNSHYPFGYEAG
jgi:hypothetical protein